MNSWAFNVFYLKKKKGQYFSFENLVLVITFSKDFWRKPAVDFIWDL